MFESISVLTNFCLLKIECLIVYFLYKFLMHLISYFFFLGACHQNDRDRTREFLISWIKITSRKQPWFDKVRAPL